MRNPKELSKKEVIQLFAARAGGATVRQLAEQFDLSEAAPSRILRRYIHADVPIPPEILKKVQAMSRPSAPRRSKKKQAAAAVRRIELLSTYMVAVQEAQRAREACLQVGITEDQLDALDQTL